MDIAVVGGIIEHMDRLKFELRQLGYESSRVGRREPAASGAEKVREARKAVVTVGAMPGQMSEKEFVLALFEAKGKKAIIDVPHDESETDMSMLARRIHDEIIKLGF